MALFTASVTFLCISIDGEKLIVCQCQFFSVSYIMYFPFQQDEHKTSKNV